MTTQDWTSRDAALLPAPPSYRRRRHPFRLFALWIERRIQRRALAALDDRPLKDVGISRSEARREAGKPFWR